VSWLRPVFSAALGLALLGKSLDANAFCLTHGCNDRRQTCEYDQQLCLVTGPLLHWGSSCVSFDVQADGSPFRNIAYADAHQAVVDAFTQWLSADCGAGVGPDIHISDFGPVACHKAEYNQASPNANIFMFRDDDWPYENAIDTLALTTLIFNADNGEIYDADVEVNTFESAMSLGNVGRTDVDFHSVITHEIGHFLGLSHSSVPQATMGPRYAVGDTEMASISQDDIDGVCTALPAHRETTSRLCDPRHGFSGECAVAPTCGFAPGNPGGTSSLLLLVLAFSSTLLRRRARP
jgi:hypothetical protein